MEAIINTVEGRDKRRSSRGFQWSETFINTQQDILGNPEHPQKQRDKWGGWEAVIPVCGGDAIICDLPFTEKWILLQKSTLTAFLQTPSCHKLLCRIRNVMPSREESIPLMPDAATPADLLGKCKNFPLTRLTYCLYDNYSVKIAIHQPAPLPPTLLKPHPLSLRQGPPYEGGIPAITHLAESLADLWHVQLRGRCLEMQGVEGWGRQTGAFWDRQAVAGDQAALRANYLQIVRLEMNFYPVHCDHETWTPGNFSSKCFGLSLVFPPPALCCDAFALPAGCNKEQDRLD